MLAVVRTSIVTCLCLVGVSFAVYGNLWHGVIVAGFIAVLYIFENVVLFKRNNQLEADLLVKEEIISKLKHYFMELNSRVSELEDFKRRSLMKASLQSNSAKW